MRNLLKMYAETSTTMAKCRLIIFFLLLIQVFPAKAQEQFGEPDAKLIARVPFRMLSGGVILLRGKVNDFEDSLSFILDTGSGGISLDSMTCVRLEIPLEASDKTIRGIGGIRTVKFLNHARLILPGMVIDSLDFHVNDYDILTSVYGLKIDGIIGYSFLSRYIVRLDYDSSRMEVFSQGDFRYKRGGFLLHPTMGTIPVQSFKFKDDRKLQNRFYFDTGAGLCFLLSQDYVDDSSVMRKRKPEPVITQAEGLGGKMKMKLTTVRDLQVGPYHFNDVPTYIFDDKYNVTAYPYLGGLLGNDILRRFNVTLNYKKKEIHLLPNSAFHDAFDYSYTGLGIYFVEGKVLIDDIIPDSPGEKAGFQPGDVLIGINNNYSNNIQTYKMMMQNPGEKLRFLILRNGEPFEIYMKPKSILRG